MMMRVRSILFAVLLAGLLAAGISWPSAAQQISVDVFPTSAIIRGENVWLRFDPSATTDIVTYLDRGDAITLTGESVAADGDVFYPVEVVDTGETGWIRDLFIDPGSIDQGVDAAAAAPNDTQAATPRRNNRANRANRAARNPNRGQSQTQDDAAAPDPAAEPEPAAVPDPAAPTDVFSFSGSAPTVTDPFTVTSGVLTVTATHEGDANFSVLAYSEDGYEELLINEIGPFDGQTTLEVEPGATLTLDVDANGPWTIAIEPPF
ncbi:MAG: SH3 domain-containing protein [Chloroflexota bacterium]|nr:SH3 domain-containing protein [Chloroflexota bacterium]